MKAGLTQDSILMCDKRVSDCIGASCRSFSIDTSETYMNIVAEKHGTTCRILELLFKDGSSVRCGFDTEFFMDDGEPKKASDVVYGDKFYTGSFPQVLKEFKIVEAAEDIYCVELIDRYFEFVQLKNGTFARIGIDTGLLQ